VAEVRRDPDRAGPVRLAGTYLRVGIQNELQYRVNFFVQMVQSVLQVGTSLVVLAIIFSHTDSLAGWSRPELLAVIGVYTLVHGVVNMFVQPNMERVVSEIREGKLDYALTKPADSQVLVSVRDVRFWQITDVIAGLVVIVVALVQLRETLQPKHVAGFVVMLTIGTVAIYCFWLMLATAAFWLIRVDEVQELFNGLYRAGQYPVGIYPMWLKFSLTFLVPLAFAITVPAQALTGRLSWGAVAVAMVSTCGLVLLSRWFWMRGLGKYDGASA
jgi:ABC-2 type transport system permease protein